MPRLPSPALAALAREALAIGDVASAAFFVRDDSGQPALAAAAGIAGPALDGLVAAVRNPAHPVARAFADEGPTFDVTPINAGGPALRSHLPIRPAAAPGGPADAVLAVAHHTPTSEAVRTQLIQLTARAAAAPGQE